MSELQPRIWTVELANGNFLTVSMPSFRQIIQNPDGSDGSPVPLDGNALEISTESGIVRLEDHLILSGELTDEGFRLRTHEGQYVGALQATPISRVVITGFVGQNAVTIPFSDVVKFKS